MMPCMFAATQKRLVVFQRKGYFLDTCKREVLRRLYKVLSILFQVQKDAHHLRFIRSAQTSKANS